MLARLWYVFAVPWALACLWGGVTGREGMADRDLMVAFAPLILGWLITRAFRFVTTGTIRRMRGPVVLR